MATSVSEQLFPKHTLVDYLAGRVDNEIICDTKFDEHFNKCYLDIAKKISTKIVRDIYKGVEERMTDLSQDLPSPDDACKFSYLMNPRNLLNDSDIDLRERTLYERWAEMIPIDDDIPCGFFHFWIHRTIKNNVDEHLLEYSKRPGNELFRYSIKQIKGSHLEAGYEVSTFIALKRDESGVAAALKRELKPALKRKVSFSADESIAKTRSEESFATSSDFIAQSPTPSVQEYPENFLILPPC